MTRPCFCPVDRALGNGGLRLARFSDRFVRWSAVVFWVRSPLLQQHVRGIPWERTVIMTRSRDATLTGPQSRFIRMASLTQGTKANTSRNSKNSFICEHFTPLVESKSIGTERSGRPVVTTVPWLAACQCIARRAYSQRSTPGRSSGVDDGVMVRWDTKVALVATSVDLPFRSLQDSIGVM